MEFLQGDHIALLMCGALGGYHSQASYDWSENGKVMPSECHPLLYTTAIGVYTCTVTSNKKSAKCSFEVTGII